MTARAVVMSPGFSISQVFFVAAWIAMVTIGILDEQLSKLQLFSVIVIPVITLVAVAKIYRRLRTVRAEREPDASEELLAAAIAGMESLAVMAVLAIVS
ncbi:MAG: hypothetical protein OXQ28_15435 [Acidobacteriota bacterium]|nr:hypothetical protein [Acidobacteriota bacterium]